jgi:serine/threonine protein kinase
MSSSVRFSTKELRVLQPYSDKLSSAEDVNSSLPYTVKQVTNPSNERLLSLRNEIKVLKTNERLHPNIISLLWYEETPTSVNLFYEYCNQGTLASYRKIEPLKVFSQLCQGVQYLHRRSIVHKNLTIDSVFVNDSIVKIGNFELAEETESLINIEPAERVAENIPVGWRPPEVQNGGGFSKESDIWNLGLIFYYLLFKEEYKNQLPEQLKQQFKDIFALTLKENPRERASIDLLLRKTEERIIRTPSSIGSCSCLPSRFFASSKSTTCLIQRAIANEFKSTKDPHLKRLIEKVVANPQKITKFYSELFKIEELENDIIRLRACCLLFLYLKNAPLLVYNQKPGPLEALNFFQKHVGNILPKDRNETTIVLAHAFCKVICMKFYIVKAHLSFFDGTFSLNRDASHAFYSSDHLSLVSKLLSYWDTLLTFHELLMLRQSQTELIRFIRLIIGEEQVNLHHLLSEKVSSYQLHKDLSPLFQAYCNRLAHAKRLFEADNTVFPEASIAPRVLNILAEDEQPSAISFHSCESRRPPPRRGFTPIDLDRPGFNSESDENERPGTVYATPAMAAASSRSVNKLPEPNNELVEILSNKMAEKLYDRTIKHADLEFVKLIGNGSSCEVWLGKYRKKEVAVKKQKSSERNAVQEFYRELTVLVSLRHQNLITFIGACTDNPLCIITEYCAGGDLFTFLHKTKHVFITWRMKLSILKEIAKGMQFLHANSFIHRDLKSLNILLSSAVSSEADPLHIKISDFGLTKAYREEEFMTGQLGTCHWMAPEVLASSSYTQKADVYSYAVVMYEVITREYPYRGKSPEEIRTQVLQHGLRPSLETVAPSCPPALRSLMVMCWNQAADNRCDFNQILGILNSIKLQS